MIRSPVQDVGEVEYVATVSDPVGNIFDVIEAPNFPIAKVPCRRELAAGKN
jgi:hypothetical protein